MDQLSLPRWTSAFCAALVTLTPALYAKEKAPITDTKTFAAPLAVPREKILKTVEDYLVPTPITAAAPSYEIISKTKEEGYERWYVHYALEDGEVGKAWLLVPDESSLRAKDGSGRLPLILALHPTGPEGKDRAINRWPTPPKDAKEVFYRNSRGYGLSLVKRGFLVFVPDQIGFGERSPLKESKKYWEQLAEVRKRLEERHPGMGLNGKITWDLRRALDFLVTLDMVDGDRIAAIGHSLGAWASIIAMPVDQRIKAAVISHTGPLRWQPKLWSDSAFLENYLKVPTLTKMGAEFNQNLFYMLMAPRPQFVIWSIADDYDQPPGIVEAVRVISEYNRYVAKRDGVPFDFTLYLHPRGHNFPDDVREAAFIWLEQRLSPGSGE